MVMLNRTYCMDCFEARKKHDVPSEEEMLTVAQQKPILGGIE